MKESAGSTLLFVENRYPHDPRVRNEATALVAAGYRVTVISLRAKDEPSHAFFDGVEAYRIPRITLFNKTNRSVQTFHGRILTACKSLIGYLVEYSYFTLGSLFISMYVCARQRVDIIHLNNPPDTLWTIAALYKLLGKKVVFDHHDLSPELYLSRYGIKGEGKGMIYRTLLLLEKINLKIADVVIATNESYRASDIRRGNLDERKVFIVRNGPDLNRVRLTASDERLKSMNKKILAYIGIMGPQDGVDYLIRALHHLVYGLGRTDFYCVLIGKGDSLESLKTLAHDLKIDEHVWFTGFIPDADVIRYLSTADICVDPDPSSPLNDVSTWIKIMEYMALEKPIVTFDLKETRFSAGDAALYVRPNDEEGFAQAIVTLMDDAELRRQMGKRGRERVERELHWGIVKQNLLDAYAWCLTPGKKRSASEVVQRQTEE
ncbi:MAG: glycosyl transferase group 1 [Nitrospirae bacterium]|nr:glycosyl transferase group 1 [Nitrospirota bacterium]